jgi:signal peptidase I
LATLLTLFATPLGFLYLGRPGLALASFGVALLFAIAGFITAGTISTVLVIILSLFVLACTRYAFSLARNWPADTPRAACSRWYALLGVACAYVLLTQGTRVFLFEPFKVPSSSMLPTLQIGARIIVAKWGYGHYTTYGIGSKGHPISAPLAAGDLLVFDYPVDHITAYIKRLIGLPGDSVDYHNKQLTVNGKIWSRSKQADVVIEERLTYSSHFVESNGRVNYHTLADDGKPTYEPSAVGDFKFKQNCQYDSEGFRCTVPAGHYFLMGDNRDNTADSRYWGFVSADHIIGKVVHIIQ